MNDIDSLNEDEFNKDQEATSSIDSQDIIERLT